MFLCQKLITPKIPQIHVLKRGSAGTPPAPNSAGAEILADITTFKTLPSTYLGLTTHLAVNKKVAKRNAETEIHSLNVVIY